jgi:SpoVK/Ycf46/Vps4 family AAA+-type ATPase
MARGEIIRKLFQSFSRNEREGFYSAAMELIEDEKSKNHNLLARDLEKILLNGHSNKLLANNTLHRNYPEVPKDKETGLPLIDIKLFDLTWNFVILEKENLKVLQRVTLENRKKEILEVYGLHPKSKLLFCGPPGCGKTLTAKVVSGVLGIPLVYVNLAAVFSSYLGETATNLKKIFDYVDKGEWVVLFDEFDAIARERNNSNEHGEVKRLVNSLLQLMDTSNSNSLFIAATNHESLLDNAIWRRFDEILFFDKPDVESRKLLLKQYLSAIRHTNINIESIAAKLDSTTGADIERICIDAIKTVILRGDHEITNVDLTVSIERYLQRKSIISVSEKLKEGEKW